MIEFLTQFHFLRPVWLLALAPTAFIAWRYAAQKDQVGQSARLIAPHLLKHLVVRTGERQIVTPGSVLFVALVIACVAMAGPSWQRVPSPFADDTASVMIVLKVTPSMERQDLPPSRLDHARFKISDLLDLRQGARTGLAAYSGSAHLVVPPTGDGRIVEQLAGALSSSVMPSEGDALAQAVSLADAQLARDGGFGSIVVVADEVAAPEIEKLGRLNIDSPVQVLGVAGKDVDAGLTGLAAAADALGTSLVTMTVDDADVRRISDRTARPAVATMEDDEDWRDAGYVLLPFVLLMVLAWSIRGWSLAWE